ncbi:hypothetical protein HK096_011413, partial [Nowakowskiella sp. JEL0078]
MSTITSKLEGKVALVTGSSRGIGRAVALRLAQDGAHIIINYNSRKDEADAAVSEILSKTTGVKVISLRADVSKIEECDRLVAESISAFGKIDILVLNAGVLPYQSLDQITPESYDFTFGVNVKGPLFLTQKIAPNMAAGSRIIFFSTSLTGLSTITPNYTIYAMTKGAIEQLSRVLAKDLGKRGITVNTISPGPTSTELFMEGKTEQQ